MHKRKIIVVALLLLIACSRKNPENSITVPNLIEAANKRGNITGQVNLYDSTGAVLSNNSGVTVSIDNSTLHSLSGIDGKWSLDSIPYGTYTISFSKTGFGSGKLMGVFHDATNHTTTSIKQVIGMNALSDIDVSSIRVIPWDSDPAIATMIAAGTGRNGIHIDPVFTNTSPSDKPVRLFFSDKPDVSITNYIATEKSKYSGAPDKQINEGFDLNWFKSKGFTPGKTIYLKAYGDGYQDDSYKDPTSGNLIFPSLSAKSCNTVSFELPLK